MATVSPESPDTAHALDDHASGGGQMPGHDQSTVEQGHAHPTDWLYVKVAIALALLTAFEVFTYFETVHGWGDTAIIVMLVAMMLLKFFLVVAFFMHLKFDAPIFWRLFVFGLILAMAVYMVMLTAFRFW